MDNIQPVKNYSNSYGNGTTVKPLNTSFDSPYGSLIRQVQAEFLEAQMVLNAKIIKWQRRLKVYQNQRRDEDTVGDKLLFTTMQTVIASLYSDQLLVQWQGEVEGDDEVAEALTYLAQYDHRKMHKDIFDYFWAWDTCFFGRSIVYQTDFDLKKQMPIPDLQNPMLFYRDPLAVAINGDYWNGRNACRFFGRWIEMTKPQMKAHPEFFDIDTIKASRQQSWEIQVNRQAYQQAQGLTPSLSDSYGDNKMYPLLEWCTNWVHPGETEPTKTLVTLGNEKNKVIRIHQFKENDAPSERWPVIDRPMYPMAHDWDGTSVPDICEDDQRARAILKNLGIKSVKADLYPMYVFDKNRVKNEANLNFGFNKFIGIDSLNGQDVRNALSPMQKSQFNIGTFNYIMESLESDAERGTATPQMQQGNLNKSKRLATELNLVDRNIDTRYSLAAKVWGWSEADFWKRWYQQYKDNFAAHISEKIIRIDSAYGAQWRKLVRSNIIGEEDPDVSIVSKNQRDAENVQLSQEFVQYLTFVAQIPGANLRYGVKRLGKMLSFPKDELERLLPPTPDERIAEDENLQLNANKPVLVQAGDDHVAHLEIHARADDTPAAYAHRKAHIRAIELYKQNPNLMPQYAQMQQQQQGQQQQQSQQIPPASGSIPSSVGKVGQLLQNHQSQLLAGTGRPARNAQGNLPAQTSPAA